ncbi:MAG: metallophosphoesterase family protein [Chloroflexota bacterium]|nr:metallophosphoesterase family protein [Chloroflexota bacterium]
MAHRTSPTFAVIADLHGNLPALDAVLADLERVQPDAVVIAGDFVNRGPESHAVVARAMRLGFPAISGNHDTWLASLARGERQPDGWETPWWTPVRRATEELTPADLAWLDALPATLRVELPGAAPALIVHGSPRHSREGMGRMTSDERLADALAGVEERTIIGAHIHYPWDRWLGDRHAIVIGAVGCPFNGDTSAQYGLFTWRAGGWEFTHCAVPYDHEPLYAAWRDSGYLDDGGAAAALMLLEHQTARTQYVPFWEWASANGLSLSMEHYPAFSAQRHLSPPPPPPTAARRRAV